MARTATTRIAVTRKIRKPKRPHATLEIVLGGAFRKPLGDLAVARARPGRGDNGPTRPADDARAEEQQAVAVVIASGIERPRRALSWSPVLIHR
jgi:hypothetical protein